ncbi:hypothetical protein ACF0H5_022374 [Mactra antiquata]
MPVYDVDITTNEETSLLGNKKIIPSFIPKNASKSRKSVVMFACLVLQFITVGYGYGLSVLYVEIIRVFNSPRSEAALIQSLYFGFMTGGGVCWAWLINTVGPGPCTMGGAIIGCLGFIISGLGVNVSMVVIFTGAVAGIGMSFCYLGSFVTVSWVFHENPGVSLVFLTTGSSLGQVVMPYVIEILITAFGWKGAFLILGAISLNCVACGVLIYTSKEFYHKGDDKNLEGTVCDRICDRTLLTDPILLMTLLNVLLLATSGPIEAWFLVDLMVLRGYERSVGSFFVSLTGFANFLGRGLGGVLRLFCRIPTVYHWVYLAPIVGISHMLVLNFFDYWPLFGANLLYGTAFGVTVAQEPAIMFEASGLERYPKGIALMNLMYGIGNFVGGLLGGIIKDETGSYDLLFYIATAASVYVAFATVGIILCMRRSGRLDNQSKYRRDSLTQSVKYSVIRQDVIPVTVSREERESLLIRSYSYS